MHTFVLECIKLQMRLGGYKQHRIINSARGLRREKISFVEHTNINKIYCNDLTCYFQINLATNLMPE